MERYTLVPRWFFFFWEVRLASKIFRHFVEMNYYMRSFASVFQRMMMSGVPIFHCSLYEYVGRIIGRLKFKMMYIA